MLIDKLKHETRKHPDWQRVFLSWIIRDEKININIIIKYFLLFKKYKKVLKISPNETNLLVKEKNSSQIYKKIVINEIHKYKVDKLINVLKKTSLYNKKIENQIKKISNSKIDIEIIIKSLKSKVFITSEELFEFINTCKDEELNWNKKYYLNKIRLKSLKVSEIKNYQSNGLLIEILDYRTCSILGSRFWCIVKSEQNFRKYKDKMKSQYIYFDFNKSQSDPKSMLGFSVMINGHISESYLKNNKKTPLNLLRTFDFKGIKKEKIQSTMKDVKSQEDKFNKSCMSGDMVTFDNLISIIDPSKNNNLAVRLTATYGNIEILNKLLEINNVNPADLDNRAFQDAAKYGNLEIIKRLLKDDRINPTALNNIAFCQAAERGMIDVVKYFLQNNIGDPSVYSNRALNISMDKGYLNIANELLKDERVLSQID
jgi:hypothetical protein